jgi:olfactory receptor
MTIITVPKLPVSIKTQDQNITYTRCLIQVCFVIIFTTIENFLLAVMAYDNYVAICHPLRYTVIMNLCLCVMLVLVSLSLSG